MRKKFLTFLALACSSALAITSVHGSEAGVTTLAGAQATIESLGTGTAALIGGDLTDPENDGNEAAGPADPSWNWAEITSSHEPGFDGAEAAFNVFDNTVGGGNAKWCCDDPVEGAPVWVAVRFPSEVSLTHFTLTSGNDSPDRDPIDFAIQGSADGQTYTDIFHYNSDIAPWTERNEVLKFTLAAASPPYRWIRYIAYDTPGTLHQLNEIEYFGTVIGGDRLFLSGVNPLFNRFTFRASDVGTSTVDPASVRLTIDNQAVTPVTNVKTGAVTQFTYVPTPAFAQGSTHTYAIEVRDVAGNVVTDSGSFSIPFALFPSTNILGTNVLANGWRTRWIFGAGDVGSGQVAFTNLLASTTAGFTGVVVDSTNSVINLISGGLFGNDVPVPDEVASHPSGLWTGDNYVFYAYGNVNVPEAGQYTFGVHSDDGFALRIRGGTVLSVSGNGQADPVDPEAVIHPGTTGDSNTRAVYQLSQGVHRVEFMFYEAGGGDNAELYAARGAFTNDTDTVEWRLVGDVTPSQQFASLGVTTNGWSVVSSDPGGEELTTWADALADLEATGGPATNYARLYIGDPVTNAGYDAFPKNTAADDDDWAIRATATLVVPVSTNYVIGFNSDDGAYVKTTGQTFTEIIANTTGLSVIEPSDTVTCDCLTGDSNTRATITLTAGSYPIEAGMFERGGGAYLQVVGGQVGSPRLDVLRAGGAGTFSTGEALLLTDAPAGGGGPIGDGPNLTATRSGNNLTIQWAPTGGTLQFSPSLTSPTWTDVGTDNPATVQLGAGSGFYRVRP
jgi:hypothetical protein